MSTRRKPEFDRFTSGLSQRVTGWINDEDYASQDLTNIVRSELSRIWKYLIEKINDRDNKIKELESKLQIAEEALKELRFYGDTNNYIRPDRDRYGMGGMSARTNFEIDDGEWKITNGEKEHYCYGKRAREALAKYGEKLKSVKEGK